MVAFDSVPDLERRSIQEACAHHDEGILFRKIDPDALEVQCKEVEGDDFFGELGAAVAICELGAEPPESSAPTELETSQASNGSFASIGLR